MLHYPAASVVHYCTLLFLSALFLLAFISCYWGLNKHGGLGYCNKWDVSPQQRLSLMKPKLSLSSQKKTYNTREKISSPFYPSTFLGKKNEWMHLQMGEVEDACNSPILILHFAQSLAIHCFLLLQLSPAPEILVIQEPVFLSSVIHYVKCLLYICDDLLSFIRFKRCLITYLCFVFMKPLITDSLILHFF